MMHFLYSYSTRLSLKKDLLFQALAACQSYRPPCQNLLFSAAGQSWGAGEGSFKCFTDFTHW